MTKHSRIDEIRIFTFRLADTVFGTDMDQISEMREPDQVSHEEIETLWFHEVTSFRDRTVAYESPKVIFIKGEEKTCGIIIDQPAGINVPVKIADIQPLPPLIETCCRSSPIWGVAIQENTVILLVDFFRLIACKPFTGQKEQKQ